MGIIYSLPLCSRADNNNKSGGGDEVAGDDNNNQPMPSMHAEEVPPSEIVVSDQPLSARHLYRPQREPTGLVNYNAKVDATLAPAALSNPDSEPDPLPEIADFSNVDNDVLEQYDYEDDVDDDGDEEDGQTTSDSGLEHSSSDELEQLAHAKTSAVPSHVFSEAERPRSQMDNVPLEDESEADLPLDNHETCEEDNDEEEDVDEPVERPPEPFPEERSVSSSPLSSKSDDTANAISNLLSEIVGSPEDKAQEDNFANTLGHRELVDYESRR